MKKFLRILYIIVLILGILALLTKKGFIPNYLNAGFLYSTKVEKPIFHPPTCPPGYDCKPMIYLYPTKTTDVSVILNYDGNFTSTYPLFDSKIGGWNVTASPDGTLIDKRDNKEYSYIFREGDRSNIKEIEQGFVVQKKDYVSFLQEKLSYLGLTVREYNEFIVYRLPRMQKYDYVKVYFAGKDYTDEAKLTITPQPDSIQRVFMVFEGMDTSIKLPVQSLKPFKRSGFSVIERGGTEIYK